MSSASLQIILKVLMLIISVSWACLWLLRPTELWKRSWREAEQRTTNSLYGISGLDILAFSTPMIVVAIIGFIYLQLGVSKSKSRCRRTLNRNLSNPIIIRSPMGIVSMKEVLTTSVFIIFLGWTFYSNTYNGFKKMKHSESENWQPWYFKTMKIGVKFGFVAEACLALLLFPILRVLALPQLLGLQYEVSVRYHIWLGNTMMLFSVLHGFTIMFAWGIKHSLQEELLKWQKTGSVNLAGEFALMAGLIIWITSIYYIRRKWFELFYWTHHLYGVFIVFFLFHVGDRHFYTVISGVLLFTLDKILRIVQSKATTSLICARILPCQAIELILSKHPSMKYTATSTIFVKIPTISKFQWHPFSIASSSSTDTDRISIIAKCQGEWTKSLYNTIHDALDSSGNQIKSLPVAIEGPYGAISESYLRYESLLLVAGGSGITPFLSILQEVATRNRNKKFSQRIQLIYIVKKSKDLTIMNTISTVLLNRTAQQEGWLKLQVFVTQEQRPRTTLGELLYRQSHIKSVCFDASYSKNYISEPESLPWRATLIAFHFIIFLASLGCLNHAFLHPPYKANPSWVRALCRKGALITAMICSASAAALLRWQKMRNETRTTSKIHGTNTELQLLEEQTPFCDNHTIHYRQRPDFQDIFSSYEKQEGESSVRVLVCGPESMQKSVASVCRQYAFGPKKDEKRRPSFIFQSLNFSL
ncbi:hypothetical protein AMTRI_Chr06g176670 [Amborella trichopoda]